MAGMGRTVAQCRRAACYRIWFSDVRSTQLRSICYVTPVARAVKSGNAARMAGVGSCLRTVFGCPGDEER